MRFLDFSTWQGAFTTLLGIAVIALVGVGIRVLVMLTIQQRQQRMNRQINERLKTLISAYRTLGGSFTGELTVNPAHLGGQREKTADTATDATATGATNPATPATPAPWDRPRLIRDAVEAALSDILLLGTEEHVRLAAQAASDMAAGRPIHTAELVSALRRFIRLALDLDPIPENVTIPLQGPTRPQGSARGGRESGGRGTSGGGAGGAGGAGGGMGMGMSSGRGDDPAAPGN